jgi:hypothetical protein
MAPLEKIAECVECHRYLDVRYHLRLIDHLRADHELSAEGAIEATHRVMEIVYRERTEHLKLAGELDKL